MKEPITNEHGFKYYDTKPEEFILCEDIKDFLTLKGQFRTWKKENITIKRGMKYLILNPVTLVYWYRETHKHTNISNINDYVKDKNVFILKQQQ